VKVIEGGFSPEEKQEMIERLTETMVSIEGEPLREFTHVLVEEIKGGHWGIGGKPMAAEYIKVLARANA
jgi:4-oxalocrotonate tautomerase